MTGESVDSSFTAHSGGWNYDVASTKYHTFVVNGTDEVKISGDGILFGSDTAAANALDDYEEGTWTPVPDVEGSGVIGASGVSGKYTKTGRVVHINFSFDISSISGTGSANAIEITGLPFTPVVDEPYSPITVRGSAFGTAVESVTGYHHRSANKIRIEEFNGTSPANLSDHCVAGTNFKVQFWYEV